MPTNFPGALDTLTNPAAGDPTTAPAHHSQHADDNDAIEAIEAKVGIGASTPVAARALVATGTGTSSWTAWGAGLDTTPGVAGVAGAGNVPTGALHAHRSPGCVAAIAAASASITTAEVQVVGYTVPLGTLTAGSTFRITGSGGVTSTVGNVITIRIRIGTATLTGNIPISIGPTATATAAGDGFTLDALVTVRTIGATGTIAGQMTGLGKAAQPWTVANSVGVTGTTVVVNTTVANILELTCVTAATTTAVIWHTAAIEWIRL